MKIVRPSLNILLDKLDDLDEAEGILKDRFEVYNNMNQHSASPNPYPVF